MQLEQLRNNLSAINEGLFYGEIEFSYDAMGSSMVFSHPSEILGDMCAELDEMIDNENADPDELRLMLSGIKDLRYVFDLVDLNDSIDLLEDYLEENF